MLQRNDTPIATATPTQRRLAREHAERMKRWNVPQPSLPKFQPVPVVQPRPILPPDPIEQWLAECPTMLSASLIQRIVAEEYGLTRAALLGRARVAHCVQGRHVAIALCLEMLPPEAASLNKVGKRFYRDHTSVLHARERIKEMVKRDSDFAKHVEDIRAKINKAVG
jgi:hypothetical protein